MSDINQIVKNAEEKGLQSVGFISKHRTVIMVIVASAAVIAAIMQTQNYLNPARNELKYTELKSSVTTKSINQEILTKLQATQEDKTESVDSNFVPDRKNPFTE